MSRKNEFEIIQDCSTYDCQYMIMKICKKYHLEQIYT